MLVTVYRQAMLSEVRTRHIRWQDNWGRPMVSAQLIRVLIERDLHTLASIGDIVKQWESGARLVVVRSSPTGALERH